jgi:hypothetical protein
MPQQAVMTDHAARAAATRLRRLAVGKIRERQSGCHVETSQRSSGEKCDGEIRQPEIRLDGLDQRGHDEAVGNVEGVNQHQQPEHIPAPHGIDRSARHHNHAAVSQKLRDPSIAMLRRRLGTQSRDFHEAACAAEANDLNGDSAHAALQHVVIMVTARGRTQG